MPAFVDPSREVFRRTRIHPGHPPVVMTIRDGHADQVTAGAATLGSKAASIPRSDHAGTQVDALIGPGRLTFIGVPLQPRGGTAGPIRAVAAFA